MLAEGLKFISVIVWALLGCFWIDKHLPGGTYLFGLGLGAPFAVGCICTCVFIDERLGQT